MEDYIGKIFDSNLCGKFKVISFENGLYKVKFLQTNYIRIVHLKDIQSKGITDPYFPNKFGVGYIGNLNNEYKWTTKEYQNWYHILCRCYSNKEKSYKDTLVCDEWHNLQNFGKWHKENYIEGYEIDKDILCNIQHLEQKIYSPETCLIIPSELNRFLAGDNWLAGVFYYKSKNSKITINVDLRLNEKRIWKSNFLSFSEAKNFYCNLKYSLWKELIEKFNLPSSLKEILLKYDFSWSWIWENMIEEEILKNYYEKKKCYFSL